VKYTSLQSLLSLRGPLLGTACLVAACAAGDTVDPTIPGEDSGSSFVVDSGDGVDSSTTTYDSGHPVTQDTSVADTNTTSSCTGHCTQESDCTAVCSPPSGDVACCDTATSMCYVASGMCQPSTTTPDSGMPAPY
jgi:hypothetical protein